MVCVCVCACVCVCVRACVCVCVRARVRACVRVRVSHAPMKARTTTMVPHMNLERPRGVEEGSGGDGGR